MLDDSGTDSLEAGEEDYCAFPSVGVLEEGAELRPSDFAPMPMETAFGYYCDSEGIATQAGLYIHQDAEWKLDECCSDASSICSDTCSSGTHRRRWHVPIRGATDACQVISNGIDIWEYKNQYNAGLCRRCPYALAAKNGNCRC